MRLTYGNPDEKRSRLGQKVAIMLRQECADVITRDERPLTVLHGPTFKEELVEADQLAKASGARLERARDPVSNHLRLGQ
jgi:hypothetical protein